MNSPRSFTAKETRFQGRYQKSLLNTLFQAYRPAIVGTLFFMSAGFLGRIALLGNANLIGYWADSYCVASSEIKCRALPQFLQGLTSSDFLYLLSATTLLGFILTICFRVGVSRLSAHAVSRVYDETTVRTSRLPMSFFDQNPAGRVMTRFSSDYNNVFRIFGGPLAEFIGLIFDMLAMTILITIASPWFLLFWFLQAGLNFGVYRFFLPSLRHARRETALRRSAGISHFAESVNGASTIRAFDRRLIFEERFAKLNDDYLSQRQHSTGIFVRFSFAMSATTAAMFLLTGLISIWLVHTGRLSVGSIGVAFAYMGLSANILQSFFEWLGQFEEAMTGLERMNEYMRLPLEQGAKLPFTAKFKTGHPQETSYSPTQILSKKQYGAPIDIDNLSMRYRDDLPLVLEKVNINIKSGERIAVIGKTGSGKTSLIQSLFRLYPIEHGSIKVDGVEADTGQGGIDLNAYRSLIAYIPQDATLFLGTLRYNLCATENLPDAKLIESLRRVQFLPTEATDAEYLHWLNYQIEERGHNLSIGERQLVCMARCLLQDAPVVVLDEATSSVDPRSEEIITRATEEFFIGKTQIIIAHRLSTIRSCDRVVWLQNGRVHRLGPPSQVLKEFESTELTI